MSRFCRRGMSEVPVLAAGDERPYFFAAKFMPFQTQPRLSLPDDLGLHQGRSMRAIQRDDQLHTR